MFLLELKVEDHSTIVYSRQAFHILWLSDRIHYDPMVYEIMGSNLLVLLFALQGCLQKFL